MGRPAIATRLITDLHYLKHTFGLSDKQVVKRWVELTPLWEEVCNNYDPTKERGQYQNYQVDLEMRNLKECP